MKTKFRTSKLRNRTWRHVLLSSNHNIWHLNFVLTTNSWLITLRFHSHWRYGIVAGICSELLHVFIVFHLDSSSSNWVFLFIVLWGWLKRIIHQIIMRHIRSSWFFAFLFFYDLWHVSLWLSLPKWLFIFINRFISWLQSCCSDDFVERCATR